MSEIGAILVVTAIAVVPISFAVQCAGAIFSSATRDRIAEQPGTHIIRGLAAALAATYFVVGNIMTQRMVEDHQRRGSAAQDLRHLRSTRAPRRNIAQDFQGILSRPCSLTGCNLLPVNSHIYEKAAIRVFREHETATNAKHERITV